MVPKGGLHTRQVSSVVSGHCHIVLPVSCATRLPPKATSEQMGSSTTGSVVLLASGEKKLSSYSNITNDLCNVFV